MEQLRTRKRENTLGDTTRDEEKCRVQRGLQGANGRETRDPNYIKYKLTTPDPLDPHLQRPDITKDEAIAEYHFQHDF